MLYVIYSIRSDVVSAEVTLDIFQGMWHDFPMYSEGCGSSQPLWQGIKAWNSTAEFLRGATGLKPRAESVICSEVDRSTSSSGWPFTRYIYDESIPQRSHWSLRKSLAASSEALGLPHAEQVICTLLNLLDIRFLQCKSFASRPKK